MCFSSFFFFRKIHWCTSITINNNKCGNKDSCCELKSYSQKVFQLEYTQTYKWVQEKERATIPFHGLSIIGRGSQRIKVILLHLLCVSDVSWRSSASNIWAATWQNQQYNLCAQWRLRSAWASTKSDQSLYCAGCTNCFVGFVMRRLIYKIKYLNVAESHNESLQRNVNFLFTDSHIQSWL